MFSFAHDTSLVNVCKMWDTQMSLEDGKLFLRTSSSKRSLSDMMHFVLTNAGFNSELVQQLHQTYCIFLYQDCYANNLHAVIHIFNVDDGVNWCVYFKQLACSMNPQLLVLECMAGVEMRRP